MPNTRRSSLTKKSEDVSKGEKTVSPKSLLKNFVQLNETVPASQPIESPTVTNIKQTGSRRSSRRSSGMRALAKTPHALLKNFFENAPEETPIQLSSSDEASTHSDTYLAPIPRKISKMADDDQNVSSEVETDDVVRKMPRIRHKAVLQKFTESLKQQSESPGEDSGSEIKQRPSRPKKIRNKITAEDIASGIKLSQEKAAETEKSHNVTEATKTETSLPYLSVNTLNAENLQDTIAAVPETQEKTDSLAKREEKDDSASSKSENSSKRKRSNQGSSNVESLFDLSDEEEEIMQKAKMLRLRSDTAESEDVKPAEVEKPDVTKFVSEAELPEVAHIVEVAETVEVTENVDVGSKEENSSHEIEGKEIILAKETRQETEDIATEAEDSIQMKLNEINKMLQDESIDTVKTTNTKYSMQKTKEAIAYTSDTKRANSPNIVGDESNEQNDLKRPQTVSKTSKEILSTVGTDMETVDDSENSKKVESNLEDVVAVPNSPKGDDSDVPNSPKGDDSDVSNSPRGDDSDVPNSPRGDDSDVSKASASKEYLTENIDSSYVGATSETSELKRFAAEGYRKPLLASKVEESLASGDPLTSDVDGTTPGVVKSNVGSISVKDANSSMISHESSPIVSEMSEAPVQSDETKAEGKEPQSKESAMLTDEKDEEQKNKALRSLRVSTDEQDELFPSSPKETTSSGHSRSSSPASSEADKAVQRLMLPSSKSAFVEMKSARSNVLSPSTSGVSKKRLSSVRKSSKKEKLTEQENKSYRMIDSVASPTESAPSIEVSHLTKDAQILPQSPFGTMRSLQHTAERPVAPEPQAGPSQNSESISKGPKKNNISAHLKKYVIPPKVTNLLINHYSGIKIPTACLPDLGKISDRFFDNLFEALSSYAKHASRRKIEASDVELYFKRVGLVNNDKSLKTLIREYLPLEDQQLLIPVARAGNVITGGLSNKKK